MEAVVVMTQVLAPKLMMMKPMVMMMMTTMRTTDDDLTREIGDVIDGVETNSKTSNFELVRSLKPNIMN